MRRLWECESRRESNSSGHGGWDIDSIHGLDPDWAVRARVTLLSALLRTRFLDGWRDGDRPSDIVFETLARFPIPEGVQNFRPEDFVKTLRNAV